MECFTILGIKSFDCFCTIPIVFTIVIGGFVAIAVLLGRAK